MSSKRGQKQIIMLALGSSILIWKMAITTEKIRLFSAFLLSLALSLEFYAFTHFALMASLWVSLFCPLPFKFLGVCLLAFDPQSWSWVRKPASYSCLHSVSVVLAIQTPPTPSSGPNTDQQWSKYSERAQGRDALFIQEPAESQSQTVGIFEVLPVYFHNRKWAETGGGEQRCWLPCILPKSLWLCLWICRPLLSFSATTRFLGTGNQWLILHTHMV